MDYRFRAKMLRVVDGDTVDLMVDLGFNVWIKERFRMAGYNAPETWRPKSEQERALGIRATEFLTTLFQAEGDLMVKSTKTGKFGRWVGELTIDGVNLNQVMTHFVTEDLQWPQ